MAKSCLRCAAMRSALWFAFVTSGAPVALATPPETPVRIETSSALDPGGELSVAVQIVRNRAVSDLSLELLVSGADVVRVATPRAALVESEAATRDSVTGLTRRSFRLDPQALEPLTVRVRPAGEGNHQLTLRVHSAQPNGDVWGDSAEFFHRVENGQLLAGWTLPNDAGASLGQRLEALPSDLSRSGAQHIAWDERPGPLAPSSGEVPSAAGGGGATDGTITVSGYWLMSTQGNVIVPQRERLVQIIQFATGFPVAQTYTNLDGFYQFPPIAHPGVFSVRVYTQVNYNRAGGTDLLLVRNQLGGAYHTSTGLFNPPDGNFSAGVWFTPDGDPFEPAYWAFNAVQDVWRALYFIDADPNVFPGSITAEWYPGSTEATRYRGGDRIYLDNADPLSPDTVVHEASHNVMWNVYGGAMPLDDCPSSHFIQFQSGVGCAWSEGWADFVPLYVYNDPIFMFDNGNTVDLENRNGMGWWFDEGDAVEGNVAGALWDIIDGANEGHDFYTDPIGPLWHTVYHANSLFFCAYWGITRDFGVKTSRDNCLFQNTITQCGTCLEDPYENDDSCAAATHEAPVSTYTCEHCTDSEDWQYVDVTTDRTYTWETKDLGYLGDTVLEIYDDSCGTLLAANNDKSFGNWPQSSLVQWTAPSAQRIKVRTRQHGAQFGPHRSYDIALTNTCASLAGVVEMQPPDGAEVCSRDVLLSWVPNGVGRYHRVYMDGWLVCWVTQGETSCVVPNVADGVHSWFIESSNACSGPFESVHQSFDVQVGVAPTESPTLTLEPGDLVRWTRVPAGTLADVVRGSVSQLQAVGGDYSQLDLLCLADDQAGEFVQDAGLPAPEEAFFYLVRPVGCALAGSFDDGSPGLYAPRDGALAAAPGVCP